MGPIAVQSPDEMHALGCALGRALEAADFVALVGAVGAGKTALVRGATEGAGARADDVRSPSFSLLHTYQGRFPIYHADWYRLSGLRDIAGTGFFDLDYDRGACLVEWADIAWDALPCETLIVELSLQSDGTRVIATRTRGERAACLAGRWLKEYFPSTATQGPLHRDDDV